MVGKGTGCKASGAKFDPQNSQGRRKRTDAHADLTSTRHCGAEIHTNKHNKIVGPKKKLSPSSPPHCFRNWRQALVHKPTCRCPGYRRVSSYVFTWPRVATNHGEVCLVCRLLRAVSKPQSTKVHSIFTVTTGQT